MASAHLMRIGLVSSAVPLIQGGGRFIVDWLAEKLRERDHAVETIFLPSDDNPDILLDQMAAFRMIRLDDYFERVITFRPPAHVVRHKRKVVWFIHHVRVLYDLWDTSYRSFPDTAPARALRDAVRRADTAALREAHVVFTNSAIVGERLRRFNQVDSTVLYPPVLDPSLFRADVHGDEIVCICRIEHHKRQHLLIEAMRHVQSRVRLRLCGRGSNDAYLNELEDSVSRHGLRERVSIDNRWISETEKADRLAVALAGAYVPLDEDSYGYPTLEAAHARRCTISVTDSGGVPEFVRHEENGLLLEPDPLAIAAAFDRLHADRALARRLGDAAAERIVALGIDWDSVIARLLA